jgi:glutamate N-acetyltransferase/amino-acid N-acetyltransferase
MSARSPFAPLTFPTMPPVAGLLLASRACAVRKPGRLDVMLAVFPSGAAVAGVLTRNSMPGAPVTWCRACLPHGVAHGLVVNSGVSNVCTGAAGERAVYQTAAALAQRLGVAPETIYVSSTGVIGEPLRVERIVDGLPDLLGGLTPDGWQGCVEAIMTTDTFPKAVSYTTTIGDTPVTLCGIAKGSGMVAPNMATMLVYFFTDAALPSGVLDTLLREGLEDSFHAITVDSDTSTSDTLLLFATQAAAHPPITDATDPLLAAFRTTLHKAMQELALCVVADGEGITKLITVDVEGAMDNASARRIARSIADSPLVKTAVAGADPNWGRVIMAVGKSGEPVDPKRVSVWIGAHCAALHGEAPAPGYDEGAAQTYMQGDKVTLRVDVGVGQGRSRMWTCDLTEAYISINARYRS